MWKQLITHQSINYFYGEAMVNYFTTRMVTTDTTRELIYSFHGKTWYFATVHDFCMQFNSFIDWAIVRPYQY